ncbi:hypothetical protein PYK22_00852 [Pyrinomonas methylaliphatogenes]|uniref:Uncharacterized protein n=1 Tax=Pyrinomonas methylaliphatogenes TaxID=454194 RepID=A0A0B6WVR0_9BACT|nr:hypothetical protein PYK22_00852 [Pyrinomonas methylaliphatogenes]
MEGRALLLLDQVLASLKELDKAEPRIRAQAQIADLLWKHDAPRARRLLEQAFRAAGELKDERPPSPSGDRRSPLPPAPPSRIVLQGEILRIAIKHDAKLAEQLVRTIAEDAGRPEERSAKDVAPDGMDRLFNRSLILLQMAMTIMESDHVLAARLARQSLDTGINPLLPSVLLTLKTHDRARADEIYRAALQKLQQQPVEEALMSLHVYAMPSGVFTLLPSNLGAKEREALSDDPELAREYLEVAFTKLTECAESLRAGAEQGTRKEFFCFTTAQMLLPAYDRYLPDKSAMMRAVRDELQRRVGDGADLFNPFAEKESAQELLSRAENEKEEFKRDMIYLRAVQKLLGERRFDEAIAAADKIKNEEFKSLIADAARMQAAFLHMSEGDFDTAIRYARAISKVQMQASIFASMAQKALDRNDLARATELVEEARKFIERSEDGPDKMRALVITAGVMARFGSLRAFELMRRGVELANWLDEKGQSSSDPFSTVFIAFLPENPLSVEMPLRLLARADFERALELACGFKNPERRTMAQIAVTRSALSENDSFDAIGSCVDQGNRV